MRIEGATGQVQVQQQAIDTLSRMNVGDVVRARVIEMSTNEVVLKLFDGSTLNAATLSNIDVKPGDLVDFLIKAKQDNQFVMETFKADLGTSSQALSKTDNELLKFLANNGIEITNSNIALANTLKTEKLPIDKNTLEGISNLLKTLNLKNVDEAIFMYKSGFDASVKDIKTLSDIIGGRFKLGNEMKDIINSLQSLLDDTNNNFPQSVSQNKNNQNTIINSDSFIDYVSSQNSSKELENQGSKVSLNQTQSANTQDSDILENILNTSEKSSLTGYLNNNIKSSQNVTVFENILEKFNMISNSQSNPTQKELISIMTSLLSELKSQGQEQLNTQASNQTIDNLKLFLASKNLTLDNIKDLLPSDIFKPLTDLMGQNVSATEKTALFKNLTENLNTSKANEIIEAPIQNIQTNDKIVKDIKETIEKLFTKIEKGMDTENLKSTNIFENALKTIDNLKETIRAASPDILQNVLPKLENIESGMKFLAQINQYNAYVQIPLTMNSFNTSGELYVFKRDGRKKKIDSEDVSMLVCLDTQNMGRVDSMVNVKKKNINIQMRIEDKSLINLVKESVYILHEALAEKGFKLIDLKCNSTAEVFTPSNANKIVSELMNEKHTRIDMTI